MGKGFSRNSPTQRTGQTDLVGAVRRALNKPAFFKDALQILKTAPRSKVRAALDQVRAHLSKDPPDKSSSPLATQQDRLYQLRDHLRFPPSSLCSIVDSMNEVSVTMEQVRCDLKLLASSFAQGNALPHEVDHMNTALNWLQSFGIHIPHESTSEYEALLRGVQNGLADILRHSNAKELSTSDPLLQKLENLSLLLERVDILHPGSPDYLDEIALRARLLTLYRMSVRSESASPTRKKSGLTSGSPSAKTSPSRLVNELNQLLPKDEKVGNL